MQRVLLLAYGVMSYAIGMAGLAGLVLLLHGWWGFGGMAASGDGAVARPLAINLTLLALFGVPHSIMARSAFKARLGWSPAAERGSYVLVAGLLALLLAAAWQPLPDALWQLDPAGAPGIALAALGWAGWGIVLVASCTLSHADLFGLRQAWLQWRGQPYTAIPFRVRGLYRLVRHPMMSGMLLAFWCTPDMTTSHLVFAAGMTVYIGIGMFLEEIALVAEIGPPYRDYRRVVPMVLPLRRPDPGDRAPGAPR